MIFLSSTGESIFQLIVALFIFIVVLVLTYYSTRWIANYQKQHSICRNLEVVETIKLTNNKFVQIIRAGSGKFIVVGVGKDDLVLLGQLDEDEIIPVPENSFQDNSGTGFQDILKKFSDNLPKKKE